MAWLKDLAAELPAPRDDEPADLRDRIVKELRDHLQCAFERELVLAGNETAAIRRVVEKFGDPRQLARRLWFEAMQEKIMSQRLFFGLACVMTLACLSATGMAWVIIEQGRSANQALVEQSREMNESILAALRQLPSRGEPVASPGWNPVRFRLRLDNADGPPAVGFRASITTTSKEPLHLEEVSGSDGVVNVGLLPPGSCNVTIVAPWGDGTSRTFYVKPGLAYEETVVCPAGAPPIADVRFEVELPAELQGKDLLVAAAFMQFGRQLNDHQPDQPGWSPWLHGGAFAYGFGSADVNRQFGGPPTPLGVWGMDPHRVATRTSPYHTLVLSGNDVILDFPFGWHLQTADIAFTEIEDVAVSEQHVRRSVQWPAADYRLFDFAVIGKGRRMLYESTSPGPNRPPQRTLYLLGRENPTRTDVSGTKSLNYTAKPGSESVFRIEVPGSLVDEVQKNLGIVAKTQSR